MKHPRDPMDADIRRGCSDLSTLRMKHSRREDLTPTNLRRLTGIADVFSALATDRHIEKPAAPLQHVGDA